MALERLFLTPPLLSRSQAHDAGQQADALLLAAPCSEPSPPPAKRAPRPLRLSRCSSLDGLCTGEGTVAPRSGEIDTSRSNSSSEWQGSGTRATVGKTVRQGRANPGVHLSYWLCLGSGPLTVTRVRTVRVRRELTPGRASAER